jgi:hypothetical protein
MAPLYLALAVIGTVAPYAKFIPWLIEHGLDPRLFVAELFSTRVGGFFGLDVLISAVTLIAFIRREGSRRKMRLLWLAIDAEGIFNPKLRSLKIEKVFPASPTAKAGLAVGDTIVEVEGIVVEGATADLLNF